MSDEQLSAELNLDINAALASVEAVGAALDVSLADATGTFSEAMSQAVASVPDASVVVDPDVDAVVPGIDAAVAAADGTVDVNAAGAEVITGDIDAAVASANTDVAVTADTTEAQTAIDSLSAQPIDVQVEADTTDAQASLDDLGSSATGASGGLDQASGSAEGFGTHAEFAAGAAGAATGSTKELTSAFGGLSGGMGAAVGAGAAAAAGIGELAKAGIEATGTSQRFTATLGDQKSAMDTINVGSLNIGFHDLAHGMGETDTAMQQAAASTFQFATVSGASGKEADRYSETLLGLAARAVALNPALGSVSDVAEAMAPKLARGGKFAASFGIDLNAAEVASRALTDTGKETTSQLTLYEKSAAGAEIATEKYGGALDSAVSGGMQNAIIQQRALKASFEEVLEKLGTPLVVPLFDIMDAAIPIAEQFGRVLSTLATGALPVIADTLRLVEAPLSLLADLLDLISPAIGPVTAGFIAFGFATMVLPALLTATSSGLLLMGSAAEGAAAMVDTAAASMTATPIGLIAAGLAVAATAFGLFGSSADTGTSDLNSFRDAVISTGGALDDSAAKAVRAYLQEHNQLDDITRAHVTLAQVLAGTTTATSAQVDKVTDLSVSWATHDITTQHFLASVSRVNPAMGELLTHLSKEGELNVGLVGSISALAGKHAESASTLANEAGAKARDNDLTTAAVDAEKQNAAALDAAKAARAAVKQGIADLSAEQTNSATAFQVAYDANVKYVLGLGTAKDATDALKAASTELNSELDLLLGRFLTADQATNNFELELLGLGDKLLANGFAFDENSKAGLDDQNTLDGLAQKAASASSAIFDQTGNVVAAKQPLIDLRTHVGELRDSLASQGADTSFLDTLLGTIDGAIAGVGGKAPAMAAAGAGLGKAGAAGLGFTAETWNAIGAYLGAAAATGAGGTTQTHFGAGQGLGTSGVLGMGSTAGAWASTGTANASAAVTGADSQAPSMGATGMALGTTGVLGMGGVVGAWASTGSENAGAAVDGAAGQTGSMGAAGQGIGEAGTSGVQTGMAGMPGVTSGSVLDSVNAAALAGANAHNVGYGIGASLSAGIGDGIIANDGYVIAQAQQVIADAETAARKAAQSHSPSLLFQAVGEDISAGLAAGIYTGTPLVTSAVDSMNADVLAAAQRGVDNGWYATIQDAMDALRTEATAWHEDGTFGSAFTDFFAGSQADALRQWTSGIVTAAQNAGQDGLTAVQAAFKAIVDYVDSNAQDVGAATTQGIADGIISPEGFAAIAAAIQAVQDYVLSVAQQNLEISSPSRVFAREIGLPIARGIALGIDQGAVDVHRSTSALTGAWSPFVPGVGGGPAASSTPYLSSPPPAPVSTGDVFNIGKVVMEQATENPVRESLRAGKQLKRGAALSRGRR